MIQREAENKELDSEIECFPKRDWSRLERSDRLLFTQIPDNTASTAHKKLWLFNVYCAFDKAYLFLDHSQRKLFDYDFGAAEYI